MKARKIFMEVIEISKKLLHPAFLIAIIMAIVSLALYVFQCIPTALEAGNKYDVLKDVLLIVMAIIAAGGVGIFLVLHRLLRDSVRKDMAKEFSAISGQIDIVHGFVLWGSMKDLDGAVKYTKSALAKDIDEEYRTKAKNNLAYYYADKHLKEQQWHLKDEAIELAEYIYKKYDKYKKGFNDPNLVETYAFVRAMFAKDDKEIKEIKAEIKDLIARKDLEEIRKDLQESLDYLAKRESGV